MNIGTFRKRRGFFFRYSLADGLDARHYYDSLVVSARETGMALRWETICNSIASRFVSIKRRRKFQTAWTQSNLRPSGKMKMMIIQHWRFSPRAFTSIFPWRMSGPETTKQRSFLNTSSHRNLLWLERVTADTKRAILSALY